MIELVNGEIYTIEEENLSKMAYTANDSMRSNRSHETRVF